jgi:hypothetical protein
VTFALAGDTRDDIQPPKDGICSPSITVAAAPVPGWCGYPGYDSAQGNPVIATLPSAMRLNLARGGAAE